VASRHVIVRQARFGKANASFLTEAGLCLPSRRSSFGGRPAAATCQGASSASDEVPYFLKVRTNVMTDVTGPCKSTPISALRR
jgi:hypothetical protein